MGMGQHLLLIAVRLREPTWAAPGLVVAAYMLIMLVSKQSRLVTPVLIVCLGLCGFNSQYYAVAPAGEP